jgi:hypothetical protein
MNTAQRPYRCAIEPIGRVAAAVPMTHTVTGSVARALSGAIVFLTTAPVANTIVESAPASAWAMASRATLPC